MRFNPVVSAFVLAMLAGSGFAEEAEKVLTGDEGSSPADPEASSPVAPVLTTFSVSQHHQVIDWQSTKILLREALPVPGTTNANNAIAHQAQGSLPRAVH